jgi:tRNA (cmo5U34)-methyltransferase
MEHVRKAFDEAASRYDSQRRHVIPEMEKFYSAAVWAAEWEEDKPAVLDIGAGTGLLTALLLDRYPKASVTLVDFSEQMLALARERFRGREDIRYVVGDYSKDEHELGKYDLICSALSIHHLSADEKHRLYRWIFDALNQGGVFVNADQVRGNSPYLNARFMEYWDDFVRGGPLSPNEREEIRMRRETLDRNEFLHVQLDWLRDCGFSDVDVMYKNRMFVVFMGRKPVVSERISSPL